MNNVPPTADAGGPYTCDEGVACSVSGSGSDVPADTLTYEWDCDYDGITFTPDFTGQSGSCTYPDGPACHTAAIRVCDEDGACTIDTASVTVNNVPPTADAGGPYTCDEGVACAVSGSGTDVPADTLSYEWDCDYDGITFTPDFTGQSGSCTYPDGPASHTAAIRVCDEDGACTVDTASVTVNNVPPTADAGGPYTCDEGMACAVSGSGSDVPADTLTYEWDCDYDGITFTPDFTGQSGSCTYPDGPASHTAAIRVCDEDGACTIDTASVTVNNVPPTAGAVNAVSCTPEPSDEGGSVTCSAGFDDPGADTHTCTVDYGDGSGAQTGTVATGTCTGDPHTYADDDNYTVVICVTDDENDTDCETTVHVVNNLPPSVATPTCTPEPSNEGGSVTCSATFTDPGTNDAPFTCTVDYGDGSGAQAGTVTGLTCDGPAHVYGDNSSYTVTVCVTDKDGETGCNTTSHTVNNLPPSVGAVTCSPAAPQVSSPVTCSAGFTDPGANDAPFTCTVDYGDGSGALPGTVVGTTCNGPAHVYSSAGPYTVIVCVTDKDLESGCNSTVLTVASSAPTTPAECTGMTFHNVITGTPGNDVIYGTHENDLIFGLGGDDVIYGEHGHDCIAGGIGNDRMYGSHGDDILVGGDGNDRGYGENNDDRLYGRQRRRLPRRRKRQRPAKGRRRQ